MKEKLTEDLKEVFTNGKDWLKYEVEYAKLTAAEKITVLGTAVAMVTVIMMMALLVFVMLSFALTGVFELMMSAPLAYLCVAGVWLVIIVVLYLLRKKLISDPIAKFITKLFLEK